MSRTRQVLARIWPIVALGALVFLAYANVYNFAFLYDDEFLIQKNRFLDSFDSLGVIFRSCSTAGAGFVDSFYRPMQISSYLIVTQIFGGSNVTHHALNVSLHACNALLLFALARRLGAKPWAAFCASALWALHPLHTEAITYMSATADPLHTLFIFLCVHAFLSSFKGTRWILHRSLSVVAFAGALLSKEAAIVTPALLVAVLFLVSERRWKWRTYLATVPHWLLAFVYLALRRTYLNFNGDFSFYKTHNAYTESYLNRLYTFFATLPNYVELLVWPHGQHIDRDFPVYTSLDATAVILGALILCAALGILVMAFRKRSAGWIWGAFGVLWFFGAHVPESGVLMPLNSFFLEHWMYLPTIGVALLGAHALSSLSTKGARNFAAVACMLVACAAGAATFEQNFVWSSPITLYSNILQYNPRVERVRHNLAMAYTDLGEDQKALEQYEIILKSGGSYPQTFHNVGRLLLHLGRTAEAENYFKRAIELNVNFPPSYLALIELYEKTGRADEARAYHEKLNQVLAEVSKSAVH